MARKEPETQAMLEAKAELQGVVEDLRAAKRRMLVAARRLRAAASKAPVVATAVNDGEKYTAEGWLAGGLLDWVGDQLDDTIRMFAWQAREDPRPEIRRYVREDNECTARRQAQA